MFYFKGHNIHYSEIGDGEAVIFLHGFLESRRMWDKLLPSLTDKRCVFVDLPGMGESEVVAEVHTMELMAEVVKALMDTLNIDTATFVGHSMGGYITLAFAELFPERISKIIMLNSTFRADDEERKETRDRAVRLMGEHPKAFISMAISNWATEASREQFGDEIEALKDYAITFPTTGIIAALKGMRDRKDRSEVLRNFDKPKFLLLGEEDPLIPAEETAREAESLGVKTKIIPGGHMSVIENFEELQKFLVEVL